MPNFKTFTKRMIPLARDPYVTIQRRGIISINAAAFELLGAPKAIELLYDPDEHIIGFRAVDEHEEHAYAFREASGKSVGPYIVSGTAFTKYFGIDTSKSLRWRAALDGDVLCVDLNTEGSEVTSNRNRTTLADAVEADTDSADGES